ncbi:stalk domain-containing protein [Aminipila sp.]|uniref:stalk domain-containing protein n=1 Tax=Aminipila sp. TaxID=2060095 RepID=UPI0028A08D09|nr:stalk domain-containing protein [Aminipila sp.]
MKAIRTTLLILVVALNLTFAVTAHAGADSKQSSSNIKVDLNGNFVEFNYDTGYPFLDGNERTLVPLRAAMEAYGCDVRWDADNFTAIVEKDGTRVEVPIGQNYIKKNDFEIFTDTKAVLKNSRVYLPIRAVAEAFGAEVKWNQKTETVIIASQDAASSLLSVHFIDVGHGDSIFIDYGKYEVLIDGGVTSNGALIADYIKPYVDDNLDLIIASHGHMDHVGGLPQVLEAYQVDRVIENGRFVDTPEWYAFKEALEGEPNCIISEAVDETLSIADGVTLRIIKAPEGQAIENNNSIAALLTFNNVSVLFTGDGQAEEEAVLAQKVGKVDVFKGGHHGSYNANSTALLNVIKPEYIVISAGKGINYTHPHASALKRMFNASSTVFGTFISGTIVMDTNGTSYSFRTAASGGAANSKPLIPLQITDAGTYQNNLQ